MSRPARALINLDALRHNYTVARTLHGGRALAVIKANAYGHGALPCAGALSDIADGFAVAFLDEALSLRTGGITRPILVLEGIFDAKELDQACWHDLWLVVHHAEQLRMIERHPVRRDSLNVWLKVDSGMHRAGFAAHELHGAYRRLLASGKTESITLMSHFSRADEPEAATTLEQMRVFDAATANLPGPRSLCNSSAILAWPQTRRDWARPGILLYGADPVRGCGHGLQPVMTLESRVIDTRAIEAGERVGYGSGFVAAERTRLGLVAMGYADGYPRSIANGTRVAVDGEQTEVIGRVSMDMLSVDLSRLPEAKPGSRVELWGSQIPVNDVAVAAGTIAYELLCNVKRVRFEYQAPRMTVDILSLPTAQTSPP